MTQPPRIPEELWNELRRRLEVGMLQRNAGSVTLHFNAGRLVTKGGSLSVVWTTKDEETLRVGSGR